MDKLSELSKPEMYVVRTLDGSVASVKSHSYTAPKGFTSEPLYSQEYVSALLAELESKDDALRAIAFHVSAGGYNADSVDAEVFKQKIIDGINGISDVQIKRIAELSRLLAHNIERAEEAEKRLATPVRLKKVDSSNVPYAGDGFNAAVDYCADRVRAAGFTVQGDE